MEIFCRSLSERSWRFVKKKFNSKVERTESNLWLIWKCPVGATELSSLKEANSPEEPMNFALETSFSNRSFKP